MKRTVIAILITALVTSFGWSLVSGLQQGVDRLWLMSAVKAPGRMALSDIEADLRAGRLEIAKAKLSAFQKEWAVFENEVGFSGTGLGNIMVTLGRINGASGFNNTAKPGSADNGNEPIRTATNHLSSTADSFQNQLSSEEAKAAIATLLKDLRNTGVLEDMQKFGLIPSDTSNLQWPELYLALWKMKTDHPALGIRGMNWDQVPPPDLMGTNDPGGVQAFIRTNGWNMHTGPVVLNWGFLKTKHIKGLPWKDIRHREFQAVTANGILYVILDGFHHNCHGVAYNPKTNRFDEFMVGFAPIGNRWYAWRQPEDPMILRQDYGADPKPSGQ